MKLSDIKHVLISAESVKFQLPNGNFVPEHFHVTEVGIIGTNFIDCGGNIRSEQKVNFQLWDANDFEHRLKPNKLLKIIAFFEKVFGTQDLEIEVEYETETIGKYGLSFDGKNFQLTGTKTACLANESCGLTEPQQGVNVIVANNESCCTPGSGCC